MSSVVAPDGSSHVFSDLPAGGWGAVFKVRYLADGELSMESARTLEGSPGVNGGARSDVQRQTKIHTDGVHEVIGGLDGKGGWKSPLLASVPFHYGETFMFESTGGGGWGSALERSTATVLDDVLDEYISLNAARKHYGVVIDATSMTVDDAATKQLRAQMCSAA